MPDVQCMKYRIRWKNKNFDDTGALKGHSLLWDRADLDTSFLTLKRAHPIKLHPEMRFNFGGVELDFQSFTGKPGLSVRLLIL